MINRGPEVFVNVPPGTRVSIGITGDPTQTEARGKGPQKQPSSILKLDDFIETHATQIDHLRGGPDDELDFITSFRVGLNDLGRDLIKDGVNQERALEEISTTIQSSGSVTPREAAEMTRAFSRVLFGIMDHLRTNPKG
ncbi:MAG: hypothetical protein M1524_00790 [Patescibacteria group bacterium]|nr:hypothetical protein [Patescibacteria group bacterium]